MHIYKFYARKIHGSYNKAEIVDLQNCENYLGREKIIISIPKILQENLYFELIYDAISLLIHDVRGIDCNEIKPELIKHANDINETTFHEMSEYKKTLDEEKISRLEIQEVIDRILLYGDSFKDKLNNVILQFPINVEYVQAVNDEGMGEGVKFIRKISKLQNVKI